ncbi:DMT family transporter [Paenactinomyces guangxiensis]|uniref:EamA family transporter n=1 Tax=Paenactinomyces guangxiensis TaxID=1490290 RepID=A0A7W1WRT6_9BACL|nr:DMT family transporter [Paenactinomyces guangxiensis]MBA4494865.1 EamA family transporter [Paenactinomyces guangxiensis]MBH8591948.1 EamA family transporter [Paenactinomyces guangxiensis]
MLGASQTLARVKGFALVLTGAVLWGVSGTVAQHLFQNDGFTPEWLVVIRLLVSGILLLSAARFQNKHGLWAIWKSRHDRISLLLFGIIGMLGVQYTYFAAIQAGNAATATLLQYLAPVLITCYLAVRSRRLPSGKESVAVILALSGTFFLVTDGRVKDLSISEWALFWGIGSAFTLAFYTLQPSKLLAQWGATLVVGWGMIVGGVGFSFISPPWEIQGEWNLKTALFVVFVILFGTLIAFYCYLESLKYLRPSETSLLSCAEPLTAAIMSVVWLHVSFGTIEWMGALCIIATIILLSKSE